jgi:hypothetical protein
MSLVLACFSPRLSMKFRSVLLSSAQTVERSCPARPVVLKAISAGTSRKREPPTEGRGAARVAYAEIKKPPLDLAAGQIVGPVLAPRQPRAATNVHFGRNAQIGPTATRLQQRAPLLAHGGALPCGRVWSQNRQQHEVGSRFLPSALSSFGGALRPVGPARADRNFVNFRRQVSASPGPYRLVMG